MMIYKKSPISKVKPIILVALSIAVIIAGGWWWRSQSSVPAYLPKGSSKVKQTDFQKKVGIQPYKQKDNSIILDMSAFDANPAYAGQSPQEVQQYLDQKQ